MSMARQLARLVMHLTAMALASAGASSAAAAFAVACGVPAPWWALAACGFVAAFALCVLAGAAVVLHRAHLLAARCRVWNVSFCRAVDIVTHAGRYGLADGWPDWTAEQYRTAVVVTAQRILDERRLARGRIHSEWPHNP